MTWFLTYLCDEDTINTSATYHDIVLAENEIEAKELATNKWKGIFVCIGVRPASNEEIETILRTD